MNYGKNHLPIKEPVPVYREGTSRGIQRTGHYLELNKTSE
jgi:hypothetical protein